MRSQLPDELNVDYELDRLLGMGSSGSVHLATQRATGRPVAIKLMRLAGSRTAAKRFEREVGNLARLSHPSLVEHIAHGIAGQDGYLVTEYVTGNSLKESRAGVDPETCMMQIAEALDVLHGAGLIHRDVKPANIMVTPEGRAVLLDLGLVVDPDRTRITRTGTLPGTMNYLPQEVLHGGPYTAAADWYAWGVTFYFLREGKHPFRSADIFAAAEGEALPAIGFSQVDPKSSQGWLLRSACHPDPHLRPGSSDACRRILEGARPVLDSPASPREEVQHSTVRSRVDGTPPGSRRPYLLGGLFLVAALGLGMAALRPEAPPAQPAGPAPATASPPPPAPASPAARREGELPPEVPPEDVPPWLEATKGGVAAGLQQIFIAKALGIRLCPLTFIPGGRLLFNELDGSVGVLDLRRGEVVARFRDSEEPVQSLALAPDAQWAVLGGDDRRVRKIGIPGLEVQLDLEGGSHGIHSVAISHDGRTFAAAGDGPTVRVWDSSSGRLLQELTGHASRVISLAYQPDDRRIYAGGLAGVIRVWDVESGRAVARLPSDGRTVVTMDFDIPGKRLVAGYLDGKVRIFDVASGELRETLEGHGQHVSAVRFAPLDRELYTAAWDGDVRIWDGETYEARGVLKGGETRVMGMALTSYSVDLATLDDAGVIRLWSPQSRKVIATHEVHRDEVHRLTVVRGTPTKGDRLVGVVRGPRDTVVAADVTGAVFLRVGEEVRSFPTRQAEVHAVASLGNHALLAGESPEAQVVSLESGEVQKPVPGPGGPLTAMVAHRSTGRLALAGAEGGIHWLPGLGDAPRVLAAAPEVPVRVLEFTASGSGLVAGLDDGQVLYWRALDDPAPTPLGRHKVPVRAAAFAPGGGFLVTAADDGQLYLWDTDQGLLLQTLPAHEDRITAMTFLADGRLASTGWDGTIRLTDLAGDGEVEVLRGHDGPVEGLVARSESELVTAGWDAWLRVWDP